MKFDAYSVEIYKDDNLIEPAYTYMFEERIKMDKFFEEEISFNDIDKAIKYAHNSENEITEKLEEYKAYGRKLGNSRNIIEILVNI